MAGQLIVGLDVSSRARAEEIISLLGDSVDFYKIGYQCFYGADGLALGKALLAAGKKVFFAAGPVRSACRSLLRPPAAKRRWLGTCH